LPSNLEWNTGNDDWGDVGNDAQKPLDYNTFDLNKLDTKALMEEKKKMDILY